MNNKNFIKDYVNSLSVEQLEHELELTGKYSILDLEGENGSESLMPEVLRNSEDGKNIYQKDLRQKRIRFLREHLSFDEALEILNDIDFAPYSQYDILIIKRNPNPRLVVFDAENEPLSEVHDYMRNEYIRMLESRLTEKEKASDEEELEELKREVQTSHS